MTKAETMIAARYAEHRGVTPSRVSAWLSDGRLVLDDAGDILVDESDKMLDATLDHSKAHKDRQIANAGALDAGAGADQGAADDARANAESRSNSAATYWEERARRERIEADLREIKLREQQKALVPADEVTASRYATAQRIAAALLQIPGRVSQIIAPTDPGRAERVLTDEIRHALAELANDLDRSLDAESGNN